MKKIIALVATALLALGAQAAPGVHGTHGPKAARLAQPAGKTALAHKATLPVRKAGAKTAAARKQGSARKHAVLSRAGRKGLHKQG